MKNRFHIKPVNQSGDTIIEVMIVLAVLGMAIGLSYATANRSLLNARQAQESSEATVLAQSQVEALRTMTTAVAPNDIFQAGPYCLIQTVPYSPTVPYTIVSGSSCYIDRISYHYQIDITYNSTQPDTFKVVVSWPDVLGQGTDTVTLSYRLHQSTPAPGGGGGGGGGPPGLIGSPARRPAGVHRATPVDILSAYQPARGLPYYGNQRI